MNKKIQKTSEARLRSVFQYGTTEPTCVLLSGHFMDIEGRVLVYQTSQ